jgi:hypothetical protein
LALATITACGANEYAKPQPATDLDRLRDAYVQALRNAEDVRDANGWLTDGDRDGILWTALYGASSGVTGVNIEAAEDIAARPGKFWRCTTDACKSNPNDDKWSDWSRDMGMGLLAYVWKRDRLDILERHIAYGEANDWRMGEPLGDFRGVYTPAMVGRLFQTKLALGGAADQRRFWPSLYPQGLTGYEAHLQMLGIWHRGEVTAKTNDETVAIDLPDDLPNQALLGIDDSMLDRVKEHSQRDPRNPFFAMVLGRYTGDMQPAVNACLAADGYAGDYVRCSEYEHCRLAAWLFACGQVIGAYAKP